LQLQLRAGRVERRTLDGGQTVVVAAIVIIIVVIAVVIVSAVVFFAVFVVFLLLFCPTIAYGYQDLVQETGMGGGA
jgi:FtsH-binding integral membrane protein